MEISYICAIISAVLATLVTFRLRQPPKQKKCTTCGMTIPGSASVCPYCRRKQPSSGIGLAFWLFMCGVFFIGLFLVTVALGIAS